MFFRRSRKNVRAILIADVVGSTKLYETLGDKPARALVNERLATVTEDVSANGGRVVRTQGDGLLCVFADADDALRTVVHLEPTPRGEGASALALRVGVHHGQVVEERGGLFGDAVNTATHLVGVARPGEVLISQALVDALANKVAGLLQAMPPIAVKGKTEPLALYVLRGGLVDLSATHTMAAAPEVPGRPAATVHLSGDAGAGVLEQGDAYLVMGRDATCNVRINTALVSRRHASLERRGDRVVLVDTSMNGTWLVPDGQPAVRLLREEAPLHGSGSLSLGAAPGTEGVPTLRYEVEDG